MNVAVLFAVEYQNYYSSATYDPNDLNTKRAITNDGIVSADCDNDFVIKAEEIRSAVSKFSVTTA
jgi:hypothetical protein